MRAFRRLCRSWAIASIGVLATFSEAQEFKTDKIPEDLLCLPKQLASMPDCRFEYWSEHESTKQRTRHCYLKKGSCWRDDIYDEQNKLWRTTSFDGVDYYIYEPRNQYLFITPYAETVTLDTNRTDNPLCCWAGVFFYTMYKTFGAADWSNVALYSEQLSKHSITSLKCESPKQRRYKVENAKFEFEVVLEEGDFGFMQVLELVRRDKYQGNPSEGHYVVKVQFSDWVSIPAKDSSIVIPMGVTTNSTELDGTPITGDNRSQVIEGTVTPVFEDEVNVASFRVPLNKVREPLIVKKKPK